MILTEKQSSDISSVINHVENGRFQEWSDYWFITPIEGWVYDKGDNVLCNGIVVVSPDGKVMEHGPKSISIVSSARDALGIGFNAAYTIKDAMNKVEQLHEPEMFACTFMKSGRMPVMRRHKTSFVLGPKLIGRSGERIFNGNSQRQETLMWAMNSMAHLFGNEYAIEHPGRSKWNIHNINMLITERIYFQVHDASHAFMTWLRTDNMFGFIITTHDLHGMYHEVNGEEVTRNLVGNELIESVREISTEVDGIGTVLRL